MHVMQLGDGKGSRFYLSGLFEILVRVFMQGYSICRLDSVCKLDRVGYV